MISKFTSVVKIGFVATLLIVATQTSKAQVTKTEGFENTGVTAPTFPTTELPFGWSQGKIAPSFDANNFWDRVDIANTTNPAATIHGGSKMMRFRSFYVNTANEKGYLVSRPYDLTARGLVATGTISFWIYRDNIFATNENIKVQINNNPDPLVGAPVTLNDVVNGAPNIPRNCAALPPSACNAWVQYSYTIPAGAVWNINNFYVILTVTDGGAGGGNIYIDDFSIDTYPSAQTFTSVGLDYQNLANVAKPSADNWIIGARVTVANEATQCALGAFTFTHNGSTNPGGDIALGSTKLWWTGGTNVFSLTNAIQVGSFAGAFPVASYAITPVIPAPYNGLLNGNNYFWITYSINAGATANDYVDADFISANICATLQTCGGVGCALAGARLIDVAYCVPSYTAGTSWLNGSFTNNDYVKRFLVTNVAGDPTFTNMANDHNDVGPAAGGNDPCPCVSNGPCPFRAHPPDYENFPTATVPMLACNGGSAVRTTSFLRSVTNPTYNISVQCGTWFGSNYIAAFIDFDHDGTFTPAERILQSPAMNALTWFNGNFTIPAGVYYGNTTMRVREWYAQSNIDGCSPGYYGEVEDYTITLRPDCSPLYPGWKIWLGYTDDWNVNSNWCGGVPTINDNALIPGKGAAAFNRGAATYHPVIKTGVLATTKKLVMLNDTVEINSPVPGSLRVSDSLSIGVASAVNTSALIVDSSYVANAVVSNGVNVNTTFLPFRGSFREQKVQLMYKNTELLAQGMINGDVIDKIIVPIRIRRSTIAYPVNINMYYATNNATYPAFTTVGYTMPVPVAPANCLAPQATVPVNVFSGNVNLTGIPVNGSGNYTITLSTPFTFVNNPATPLIIEICYSLPAATINDDTWQTQTVGYRSILSLSNLGAYAPASCTWANTAPNGTTLTQRQASDLRPNLTFVFHRVFQKYPINMETNGATTSNWANYGNFVPANSIVTFMGTSIQNIDGPNPTTFDELKINNWQHVRQNRAATVNDTLWLQNGRLLLNAKTLTLNNTTLGAIFRIAPNTGYLQSEDLPPAYGLVNWKMGATIGPHVFPFVKNDGTYIPFTFNATAGTSDFTIGTYYPSTTPPSLLPWPTGVTTINSYNNPSVTDAPNMVKRFWVITNTGAAPAGDLTFNWAPISEQPTNGVLPSIVSQRWQGGVMTWDYPAVGQFNTPSTLVTTYGVTNFNTPWALTLQPEPLPVSLLNFTARPEKNRVRLDWVTASETNNDKFVVERTSDANDFTFINELKSKGPSTGTLNYFSYDNNPQIGLQFYRLTQKDYNGTETFSKLVPVTFGKGTSFEIVTTVNYDDGSFDVVFNYDSDLPYSYKIVDMLGNIVVAKENNKAEMGSNIINIKTKIATGVYTIMILNQEETVTRKIFK